MQVVPDRVIVPVEVLPSPQLMVAVKAPVGSTPLAWVNVATARLLGFFDVVVMAGDTTMGAMATEVVAVALLFAGTGSADVALTDAEFARVPYSVAVAVIVKVTAAPGVSVPSMNVTTLPERLNDPWLVVAVTKLRFAPRVSVSTTPVPEFVGSVFATVTV